MSWIGSWQTTASRNERRGVGRAGPSAARELPTSEEVVAGCTALQRPNIGLKIASLQVVAKRLKL